MSGDRFTEVTNESWFSRIGGAVKGILTGLIIFLIAFPLLFWNEGRAVKRHKTLKEGAGSIITITSDSVDSANAGQLVHVTGKADTEEVLTDSTFGISVNGLKLKRSVKMYQWKETSKSTGKKKVGGGKKTTKTYSYSRVWSDDLIDSTSFKRSDGHKNPGSMAYQSTQRVAKDVSFEAFTLPSFLVSKINNYETLPVDSDSPLPEELNGKAKVHNEGYYIGVDPASPKVGDLRVAFSVARPVEVSVVAQQVDSTFERYTAKTGGTIGLLQTGIHSSEAMIQQAQANNKVLTWVLRGVGFLLMLIGLTLILKPLSVIADVLPILGTIVGAGTGIIAFLLAAVLSLITIAIAWIVYRPLLGVVLIVAAGGLVMAIKGKLKSAKTA